MMTLHGVDVFLRTPELPDLPKEQGPFNLLFISSRGTRVWPTPAPIVEGNDWQQCRYFSDAEVTDQQIEQLIGHLTSLGWQWTKCEKLLKVDGVNGFSQPY